jgi:ribosomal protein L37E
MLSFDLCPECGVPLPITRESLWRSDGTLVLSSDTTWRAAFVESDNLGPVYVRISEVIGIPIDHLITDIFRKGTVEYISSSMPREVLEAARSGHFDLRAVAETIAVNSQTLGVGANELMDLKSDEYLKVRITEPFCIQLAAGMLAGSCEVVTGALVDATYREVSPDVYELTARYTEEHHKGLEGRLQPRRCSQREGDIELERCVSCGGPKALSRFSWNPTRGKIYDTPTSRRMVLIGPELQDLLFDELEAELGDTIPRVAVDAQKEFVKNGSYSIGEISDEEEFRKQLALCGLGNLRRLRMENNGLWRRIDNASNYLMTIGMAQGLFEVALGGESYVDWEVSENGDLEVEVLPRGLTRFVQCSDS